MIHIRYGFANKSIITKILDWQHNPKKRNFHGNLLEKIGVNHYINQELSIDCGEDRRHDNHQVKLTT